MPANPESPVEDTKKVAGAAKSAKGAAETVKAVKTAVQAAATGAEAGSGVGALVIIAQKFAPLVKKIQQTGKKALLAAGAYLAYLLFLLGLKIIGLVAGLAFGAITGLPLLAVPVAGPFLYAGWTAYWGIRGFMDPLGTLHLATHPWELITKPLAKGWNYVQGGFSKAGEGVTGGAGAIGGGIGGIFGAIGGFFGAIGGAIVGAAAATWSGITTAAGAAGGWLSGALGTVGGWASSAAGAVGSGVTGTVGAIGSGISSAAGATGGGIGGALGAIGSGISNAAGAVGGAIGGTASSIAGGVANAAGGLLGTISSLSIPSSVASIPVAAGIGTITAANIFGITIPTSASFFDPKREVPQPIPALVGDNAAFRITKTVNPTTLSNEALSGSPTIIFTITLEAKERTLTSITITDNLTVNTGSGVITPNIANPPCSGPGPSLAANQSWTCEIRINAQPTWQDSLVNNAVTVTATAQGDPEPTIGNADAALPIGNAPLVSDECPSGWPMTGDIQQGPEGPDPPGTHGDDPNDPNDTWHEAIDIANNVGTPIYATISGTLHYTRVASDGNQSLKIVPLGSCSHVNTGNPLTQVAYVHLQTMEVPDGTVVQKGTRIATSGILGSNPHLHYRFGPSNDRSFLMEPPYIPAPIDRFCVGTADCNQSVVASFP